jgi:GNAT superfamily N-acetyltransferase
MAHVAFQSLLQEERAEYRRYLINDMASFNMIIEKLSREQSYEMAEMYTDANFPKEHDGDHQVVAVMDFDKHVGWLWAEICEKHGIKFLFLYDLHIFPKFQRKGYGTAAMNKIIEIARHEDCNRMGLRVESHKGHNLEFYQRFGFKPIITHMEKFL